VALEQPLAVVEAGELSDRAAEMPNVETFFVIPGVPLDTPRSGGEPSSVRPPGELVTFM
jgi:hypothetical protein